MQEYRLNSLVQNATSLDLETDLVQPGLATPPMVLGSMAEIVGNEIKGAILSKDQVRQIFLAILADPNRVLAVFNGTYDINVLIVDFLKRGIDLFPQVFAMYDPTGEIIKGRCDGRVFDAMIAEMLHAIAQGHLGADSRTGKRFVNPETGRQGRYSLEVTHEQVTGNANAKANDRFRKSYHMFHDVPISELPFEARTYPIDDAVNTLWDVLAQAGHMPSMWTHQFREPPPGVRGLVCTRCHLGIEGAPQFCTALLRRRNTHEISRACYFAYAASLGSVWGFKIDHEAVNALEKKILDKREAEVQPFLDAGIIRPDGTENQGVLKKLVAQAYGAKLFCTVCQGTGKVPSPKTNGRTKINCDACDGTTLQLPPEVPRSPSGQVAKGADTLQESGDELLMSYNDQEGDKILSTYIPLMRRARACNHCGEPGSGKRKHKHDCPVAVDPNLEADVGYREVPLLPYINSIVETGRCAVEDGLHGLPRSGGVRECFMARPGYVYSSEDYTAGELVTLAQCCIWLVGYSKLAEALNGGLDAHLALAGTMNGLSYPEMIALKKAKDKRAINGRQGAKAANFGFPGGMAELTFTLRKRSEAGLFTPCPDGPNEMDDGKGGVIRGFKGIRTCILMDGAAMCGFDRWGNSNKVVEYKGKETAPVCAACLVASKRLREFWFQQWPEMDQKVGYFAKITAMMKSTGPSGLPEVAQFQSNRIRAGVDFCSAANGFFQGLLADAARNAYCQIARECRDRSWRVRSSKMMTSEFEGLESPLFGSTPLMMVHDEPLIEHPESIAHEAAHRASEICVEALRFMCPDMFKAVQAKPTIMRRLYKSAEPVYACKTCGTKGEDRECPKCKTSGRLECWEPKKSGA